MGVGDAVGEDLRSACGANALDVDQVFDGDRNAGQRQAAIAADQGVDTLGLSAGQLGREGDEGAPLLLEALGPGHGVVEDGAGGAAARLHGGGDFQAGCRVVGHSWLAS